MRLGVLLVGAASLGAQCEGNPQVSFEIQLPSAVSDQAQWMEIGVLPGGACPPAAQLGGGIPPSGLVERIAFEKGDTDPPAIGTLKKASYGFAAAARASDCSVLATGCTVADVTEARDISIALGTTSPSLGACADGEACVQGQCVPSTDPDDPTLGAGCSMQLVGAGPLGLPLELSGSDTASAPAIVVTESGFLIAYREYDPVEGQARLTVAVIDEGGALTIPTPTMLQGQCPSQQETDAVGAAYLGGNGLVVSARPPCSATAGFDVFGVDAAGSVLTTSFDPSAIGTPALSNAHATALSGATTGWLTFVTQSSANLIGLSGLQTTGSSSRFGGSPPQTLAEVTATDQMIALLAGNGTTLEIQLGPAQADAGASLTMPGTWGAITAQGARAFVLSDGGTGGQPLAYAAFDLGSSAASVSGSFAPLGQGNVAGGDIASNGNRIFFAAEQPGSISLLVYDNASTTPTLLNGLLLSNDPRVPSQLNVRDGRLAVAASDSRVLVAWITATSLGPDDPVGGYALYACSP